MGIHSAIARGYNIDLFEKQEGDEELIIALGSGLLMATQDLLPNVKYSFEWNKNINSDAIILLSNYVKKIWVVAWFSISKPVYLYQSLEPIANKVTYYSNETLCGHRCDTLKQLKDENISNIKKNLV